MAIIPNFPQNLLDMHHAWHMAGMHAGFPTRSIPAGNPGSGTEFLTFHKNYVAQVHMWYDTQPFADPPAVAPWTVIPIALKDPTKTFWSSSLANQETRITTNAPPFGTADELGIFIEAGIHNWIHGATATVFNEPEVQTLHSPRSTYFYNIHGLVEYWWDQWVRNHKSIIKDFIDSKSHAKDIKEHKEIIKEKEFAKRGISPRSRCPEKPRPGV